MRQKLGWRTRAVQSTDKKPKRAFCDTFTDVIFTGEFSIKTERYPCRSFRKGGEQHRNKGQPKHQCFVLLTARPSAERGSWFTRGFFFRFVGDQTQASTWPNFESHNLWCLLAKSCWNINKSHLQYWLSREKIKNPALVKNYTFSGEILLGTYTYLYSFESSMKWPFPDIFSFGVNKNLRLQNHAEPTRCQKISSKPWFRSDISLKR